MKKQIGLFGIVFGMCLISLFGYGDIRGWIDSVTGKGIVLLQTVGFVFYSQTGGAGILAPGEAGQILKSAGPMVSPTWETATGGDTISPATNTANYVPQWNGANSKTLLNGLAVGTGANNLVQLNGDSKLPAVDGSQLTNLPSSAITHSALMSAKVAAQSYSGNVSINSALDGYTISNSTATSDVTYQFDTLANLGNKFNCTILNETGITVDANTKVFLVLNGAVGSTTIVDAVTGRACTANGTCAMSSTRYKYYPTSCAMSNSGYITYADGADVEPGAGNFTIEMWIYPITQERQAIFAGSSDQWLAIDFHFQGTRNINIWASSTGNSWNLLTADGAGNGIGALSLTLNAWNHVAIVRNGNNWMSFINGIRDINVTVSGTVVDKAEVKQIGKWGAGGGPDFFDGYISEFRYSNVARYTANFTPPTGPLLTNRIHLIPPSGATLAGTTAANRKLVSSAKGDLIKLRTAASYYDIYCDGVYPSATNWVDTAP